MIDGVLQISFFLGMLALLIHFLGEYVAWIFQDQARGKGSLPRWLSWIKGLDKIFTPIENFIYKIIGLDPEEGMDWKRFLVSVLLCNAVLFALIILIFRFQNFLP